MAPQRGCHRSPRRRNEVLLPEAIGGVPPLKTESFSSKTGPTKHHAPCFARVVSPRDGFRKRLCCAQVEGFLGGLQPRTIPTKDLPHGVVFFGGWCANCRNIRKGQKMHHLQFCTSDLDHRFCGGGARILRSEFLALL